MFSPLLTLGSALNVLQTISDSSEMVQSGEKDDSIGEFFFKFKVLCRKDNNHLKNHQANDPKKQTIRNCHAHHFRSEIYKSVDDLQVIEVTSDISHRISGGLLLTYLKF